MDEVTPKAAVLRQALERGKSMPATRAMLTVEEACQYLRISKWTLYRLIQAGKLKTLKIGSRRLVRQESLAELVDQLENVG